MICRDYPLLMSQPRARFRFWHQLLQFIEDGRVIPVVGQGLLTVPVEGREVLLYTYSTP